MCVIMQDEHLSVSQQLMEVGLEGGFEMSSVSNKLLIYDKVSMNHIGSLTLAWPQCLAENNKRERRREGGRERIKHLKSLHRC